MEPRQSGPRRKIGHRLARGGAPAQQAERIFRAARLKGYPIVGIHFLPVTIREATDDDLDAVLDVERRAFGHDIEADLVKDLLADASAAPRLSLLAVEDGRPVGHVLFTSVVVDGAERPARASILAPLAVVPEAQGRGCGGKLVEDGLRRLAEAGFDVVFVFGDPRYYAHFGFVPAGRMDLEAPYPIPTELADAWMVKLLSNGVVGSISGRVRCADTLNRPELWHE